MRAAAWLLVVLNVVLAVSLFAVGDWHGWWAVSGAVAAGAILLINRGQRGAR